MGMRFYDSAYFFMVFASLRFQGCRAVFGVWASGAAICGRSIDLKHKRRPVITWETPKNHSEGKWDAPIFGVWGKRLTLKDGSRALFRLPGDTWGYRHISKTKLLRGAEAV